nr:hypothetical protein [Tanacetum cinerariifolium]
MSIMMYHHFSDLDTFSSIRRPKNSGVIWKKKGSSNTSNVDLSAVGLLKLNKNVKRYSCKDLLSCNNSHLGEASSASMWNDSMNVSCNSRMCDLLDDKNFFIFDDESVKISLVSKMPFRKKPCDSINVRSKSNMIKSLPRTVHKWLLKLQPLAKPIAKWIPRIVQICLWIINLGCSKRMTDEVVSLLEKEKENLKTIESLKSNGFESGENAISESENQSENDLHVVENECDKVENPKVISPGMFKSNVSQSVSPISMSKSSCESKNVENQLKVKRVVIDTHIECQAQYAKLNEERYEYMIRYSALCDNDKQHRKKIDEQEIFFDKMSRQQTNQTIHMIMPFKDTLYNGKKGIGFENPRYFKEAKDLRPSLYDEKVIGLGYTLMFLTHYDEALEIEKFKRSRKNKIEFAYGYGNLNAIESASENFIENHIDSQKDYDKSEVDHNDSEEKEHLVDKLIRKFNHKIAKCQKRVEKANQQSKDFENQNKDLQKYDVLINQVKTFKEQNNEFNEQIKVLTEKNADLLAQTEVLKDQLQVKHVVIDTDVKCHKNMQNLRKKDMNT